MDAKDKKQPRFKSETAEMQGYQNILYTEIIEFVDGSHSQREILVRRRTMQDFFESIKARFELKKVKDGRMINSEWVDGRWVRMPEAGSR